MEPMQLDETDVFYDADFFEWTQQTARLLRQGSFELIDLEHVAEEIEDMGNATDARCAPG